MKIAFLDRDGVINKEVSYLHKIEDFDYAENCIEGLKQLQELAFKIIIVTNQAGIARGYYTEADYLKLTSWYLSDLRGKGIEVLDVFYCPHHPDGSVPLYALECGCRKPSAGMFQMADEKYNVDKAHSIMIGDKLIDIDAAIRFGLEPGNCFLVATGHKLPDNIELRVFKDIIAVSTSSAINYQSRSE